MTMTATGAWIYKYMLYFTFTEYLAHASCTTHTAESISLEDQRHPNNFNLIYIFKKVKLLTEEDSHTYNFA